MLLQLNVIKMKQILIILGLFASVSTFAQSPRIKLNQITKDTVKGSVLISSPSDSGMVYSRDFYIAYGADTVLILYGDTILGGGGLSSVLSDGVTVIGNGTSGNPLKVDTATVISTIKGLVDTLTARNYLTTEVDGSINNEGSLTVQAGGANDAQIQSNTSGSTNVTIAGGSNVTVTESGNTITIASTSTGGGSIPVDTFVTIAGTETITGAKTFTSDLNIDAKIALNDGGNSVFIGDGAGAVDDGSDNRNVGVGSQSLYNNTSGYQNIANGSYALYFNTTGYQNVANGFVALYLNTTGYQNIANGYGALRSNTTGYQNTANGFSALYSNTQGYGNIANGIQALYFNTLGDYNIANGRDALFLNTTGNNNIANGYAALYSLSTGSNNQAYGYEAGTFLLDGSTALTNANGSMFLGNNTRASANGNTNEIVIGTNAIGNGSNTITIGSSTTQSLHTRNYEFDIDQTVGASEDNYVLTYDNGDGQISLEPISLSGSATLDFGSTSAQSSSDLTITVTGAADGDVVSLGVPNASVNANTNYTAWVSAANTVTVRFNNYSSGAVDPASGTFKVKVFK
jgi:hypothetical protein